MSNEKTHKLDESAKAKCVNNDTDYVTHISRNYPDIGEQKFSLIFQKNAESNIHRFLDKCMYCHGITYDMRYGVNMELYI